MSSATMIPAAAHPASLHPVKGATALGTGHAARTHDSHHFAGNALRAVKVFASAAFSVVLLGEYADD
ncbi:hypothetical protein [Streptomyces pinistramenti]|uniref:hypothetical protein n=1 Tax=Streptomyces pinistramenti TaxID=2884812 RepID=UPI001D08132B|nr:hypothetical protein [Streptomyces pinistramenti]MCB5908221.1 hypothetical protein [Streptomyces pinistramenti]